MNHWGMNIKKMRYCREKKHHYTPNKYDNHGFRIVRYYCSTNLRTTSMLSVKKIEHDIPTLCTVGVYPRRWAIFGWRTIPYRNVYRPFIPPKFGSVSSHDPNTLILTGRVFADKTHPLYPWKKTNFSRCTLQNMTTLRTFHWRMDN